MVVRAEVALPGPVATWLVLKNSPALRAPVALDQARRALIQNPQDQPMLPDPGAATGALGKH